MKIQSYTEEINPNNVARLNNMKFIFITVIFTALIPLHSKAMLKSETCPSNSPSIKISEIKEIIINHLGASKDTADDDYEITPFSFSLNLDVDELMEIKAKNKPFPTSGDTELYIHDVGKIEYDKFNCEFCTKYLCLGSKQSRVVFISAWNTDTGGGGATPDYTNAGLDISTTCHKFAPGIKKCSDLSASEIVAYLLLGHRDIKGIRYHKGTLKNINIEH